MALGVVWEDPDGLLLWVWQKTGRSGVPSTSPHFSFDPVTLLSVLSAREVAALALLLAAGDSMGSLTKEENLGPSASCRLHISSIQRLIRRYPVCP